MDDYIQIIRLLLKANGSYRQPLITWLLSIDITVKAGLCYDRMKLHYG